MPLLSNIVIFALALSIPLLFTFWAWRSASLFAYTVTITTFSLLAVEGMGTIVTLFGFPILGSSMSFPAVFLLISLCAKEFGTEETLKVARWVLLSLVIYTTVQFRWAATAYFGVEIPEKLLEDATIDFRNAVLMTGTLYFGALLLLSLRRMFRRWSVHVRLGIPVAVDIFLTLPVSLLAMYKGNGILVPVDSLDQLLIATLIVRLMVPAITLTGLHFYQWKPAFENTFKE